MQICTTIRAAYMVYARIFCSIIPKDIQGVTKKLTHIFQLNNKQCRHVYTQWSITNAVIRRN